jgi:hypothetical protein
MKLIDIKSNYIDWKCNFTVCTSEMLVSSYKSTRRYNLEDQHRHLQRYENLKFKFSC